MYFEMKNRILTKQRVLNFCESCILLILNGVVIVLGASVIASLVFAGYQGFKGVF